MNTPRWYMLNKMGMATLCTNKADAQQEAADAQRFWPHMGPHRAVQLVEAADVEALRTGYAAARLEIESLQARIKTMAEEHADELMVAHMDGRMRAEQPAGAQQPGVATWTPLPGTLPEPGKPVLLDIGMKYPIRAMWAAKHALEVGMEDDSGFGEYDEATDTYYCPEGWYEWNEQEETHWAVDKTPTAWCELPPNGGASHEQASSQAAPQPSHTPQADNQPAPVLDMTAMQLAESVGLIGPASRTNDLHAAIQRFHDLICANTTIKAADADRAARAPADSGAAPAAYSGNLEQELAMLIRRIVSSARRNCEDGSNVLKLANEAWVYLVRKGLNGSPLRDAGIESDPTPAAQTADSVLEDAARLDWLLLHISGAEFRRIGVHYSGNASRADVDAARKQGANHD